MVGTEGPSDDRRKGSDDMPNIGPLELILILIVALLVIGPGKLPEVGSALGKSIREFRKATTEVQESVRVDLSSPPAQPAPPVQQAPAQQAPVQQAPVAPAPTGQQAQPTPAEPPRTDPAP